MKEDEWQIQGPSVQSYLILHGVRACYSPPVRRGIIIKEGRIPQREKVKLSQLITLAEIWAKYEKEHHG